MAWGRFAPSSVYGVAVGTIAGIGAATPSDGWLRCDGTAVSRSTYADLFNLIGTYYGTGDGSTTFNVPDIDGSQIAYTTRLNSLNLQGRAVSYTSVLPGAPADGDEVYLTPAATPATPAGRASYRRYNAATANWDIIGGETPALVTTLPASPYDGQEIYYAADAPNGIIWRLRYRAASSSSYKWEFVGGANLRDRVTLQEGTASTSYTDLSTSGPTITLPLAGDYVIQVGACVQTPANTGSIASTLMSFAVGSSGGGTASDDDCIQHVNFNSVGGEAHEASLVGPLVTKTGLTSGHTVKAKYRTTAGTGYYQRRWMSVTPVRVG